MREELRTAFGTIRAEEGLKQSTRHLPSKRAERGAGTRPKGKTRPPAARPCGVRLRSAAVCRRWLAVFCAHGHSQHRRQPLHRAGDQPVRPRGFGHGLQPGRRGTARGDGPFAHGVRAGCGDRAAERRRRQPHRFRRRGGDRRDRPKGRAVRPLAHNGRILRRAGRGRALLPGPCRRSCRRARAGLSYGKYRAYLQLAALDPTATPEQVQGMSMRELRQRIAALLGEEDGQGGRGHGNGWGHGSGQGHGQGGQGHGWGRGGGLKCQDYKRGCRLFCGSPFAVCAAEVKCSAGFLAKRRVF